MTSVESLRGPLLQDDQRRIAARSFAAIRDASRHSPFPYAKLKLNE